MTEPAFILPEDQRFACRDCPARCCKQWSIRITPEEKDRFTGEEWIRARLEGFGLAMEEPSPGVFHIPMRAVNGVRQCVFLDDDDLCSIHRRHGHDFLSAACKSFPFMFLRTAELRARPVLSHYCPSIRDNYGEPVGQALLSERWNYHKAESYALAGHMKLGPVTRLAQDEFLHLAAAWERLLRLPGPAAHGVARCQFLTDRLTDEFGAKETPGGTFAARAEALAAEAAALETFTPEKDGTGVRLLLAFVFFSISAPFRLKGAGVPAGRAAQLRAFLRLLSMRGEIDLLYLPGVARIEKAEAVSAGDPGVQRLLSDYLALAVGRGTLFSTPRPMQEALHRLALALRTADLYARLRAVSENRGTAGTGDIKEGISIAELAVVLHANLMATTGALEMTTGLLALQASHMEKLIGCRAG